MFHTTSKSRKLETFEVSQLQPENVPYTTWMMRLRSFYCIAFENMITWLLAVTNMPTISHVLKLCFIALSRFTIQFLRTSP